MIEPWQRRGDNPAVAKADQKLNINVFVNRALGDAFRRSAQHYGGRLGMCFSAAMLMWLESDPQSQGRYLGRVFESELADGIKTAIADAKVEQARRIAQRERRGRR